VLTPPRKNGTVRKRTRKKKEKKEKKKKRKKEKWSPSTVVN
jgi:hypothetical protein